MEQKVVLDPALGLTAAELAAAWNANPAIVAEHGPARTEAAPPGQFNDPFVEMGFMIVRDITVGLFAGYIYDLIKDILARKPAPPTITTHQIDQPDGSKLVVVVIKNQ